MENKKQNKDKWIVLKIILLLISVIFATIILGLIVVRCIELTASKKVEKPIYQYLEDTYPNESTKIIYIRRKKINSDNCLFWLDDCWVYEKVPGKYTYIFRAIDSNNTIFTIYYTEEYDDHEAVIKITR